MEDIKGVIRDNIIDAPNGITNSKSWEGDKILYNQNGVKVTISYRHGYIEVLGLNDEKFRELREYYRLLMGSGE